MQVWVLLDFSVECAAVVQVMKNWRQAMDDYT